MDGILFLKNLIKENKPEITLEILRTIFKDYNEVNNDIILLEAKLMNIKKKFIIGEDERYLEKEYMKINRSILEIIDQYADYCMVLHIPDVKRVINEIGRYEILLWRFVIIMNTKKDYEYFLSKYPQSDLTSLAHDAIQKIEKGYLEGTVLVHLTSNKAERFKIRTNVNFGQFTDIISKLIYLGENNNKYGQEWVLELGHDTNKPLQHGSMIVEDYHSEKVKDVRSLLEMGINEETRLTVRKIGYDTTNDNEIYSDVIADYQKKICQEILKLNDFPEDIRVRAEQKIKDIEGAKVHFYLLNNKIEDTDKKPETNGREVPKTQQQNTFWGQINKDSVLLKIIYFILWAFLPMLLFLLFDALFWRKVSIADTIIILFMICLLLISLLAMRYIKNSRL